MSIGGTSGNDHLAGTAGNDTFDLSQGGNDHADGLDGDDRYLMGGTLTADDRLDGGTGEDSVILDGNYVSPTTLVANTFTSIEKMKFTPGHDYDIVLVENNFSIAATIDGRTLGIGDHLTFDANRDNDTQFDIFGGAGNDVIVGGDGGNTFHLENGGAEIVTGGDAIDVFNLGATFTSTDALKGAAGVDVLNLKGSYFPGLFIANGMIDRIETINLSGNFDYVISLDTQLVPFGETLNISAATLTAPHHVELDASAFNNRSVNFHDGAGDDDIVGGRGDDVLYFSQGGVETADGGAGDDDIWFTSGTFDRDDTVDGGGDNDTLLVFGGANVVFRAGTMHSIETLALSSGFSYDLTMNDGNVFSGGALLVSAGALNTLDQLVFDGSAETDGTFTVYGGSFDDTITGGDNGDQLQGHAGDDRLNGSLGDDVLVGGSGADRLNGGFGNDIYAFNTVSESTGFACDSTLSFDTLDDVFETTATITGIDTKVTTGDLSDTSFDSDMQIAIGANELHAHRAVVFIPSGGNLAGVRYLIINVGGGPGYQAGSDIVVKLTHVAHLNQLDVDNFI